MADETSDEPTRVACVGGSITFGLGLPDRRSQSYPSVLQRLLDERDGAGRWRVRNFGYCGATASRNSAEPYWKTPTFTAATRFEPELALIVLGTNDAQFAHAAGRATLEGDLAATVEHFRSLGAKVLLGDPPPVVPPVAEIDFEALAEVVRPTIHRVAERTGVPLFDFFTPLAGTREEFPDGLHPTAAVSERLGRIALEAVTGADSVG